MSIPKEYSFIASKGISELPERVRLNVARILDLTTDMVGLADASVELLHRETKIETVRELMSIAGGDSPTDF